MRKRIKIKSFMCVRWWFIHSFWTVSVSATINVGRNGVCAKHAHGLLAQLRHLLFLPVLLTDLQLPLHALCIVLIRHQCNIQHSHTVCALARRRFVVSCRYSSLSLFPFAVPKRNPNLRPASNTYSLPHHHITSASAHGQVHNWKNWIFCMHTSICRRNDATGTHYFIVYGCF